MPNGRQDEAVPSARAERRRNWLESAAVWVYGLFGAFLCAAILTIIFLARH